MSSAASESGDTGDEGDELLGSEESGDGSSIVDIPVGEPRAMVNAETGEFIGREIPVAELEGLLVVETTSVVGIVGDVAILTTSVGLG